MEQHGAIGWSGMDGRIWISLMQGNRDLLAEPKPCLGHLDQSQSVWRHS